MKISDIQPGNKIAVQRPGHKGKVIVWVQTVDATSGRWTARDANDRLVCGNAKNASPA
jgi:hypothetical protein